MADSTITDLLPAAALAGTEPVPIDQAGSTVRATVQAIADLALSGVASGYQPLDPDLTAIAALAPANNNIMQRKAGAWVGSTPATVKTDLAIVVADVGGLTAALDGKADDADLTGKANTVHTHIIADTTGLQAALDGKAASVHTHAITDTTGLQAALDLKAPLASPALTGTPTVPTAAGATNTTQAASTAFVQGHVTTLNTAIGGKANTTHTHAVSDVTGLVADLDARVLVAGDTLTGALTLSGAPTLDLHAATKKYVDDSVTAGGGYTDEQAQDACATMIQDGTGITWSYNDVAGTLTPTVTASGGVPTSLTLTAGGGLTGGGDLTTNRTFDVVAGTGITVNANDVALTTPVAVANGGTGTSTGISAAAQTALDLKVDETVTLTAGAGLTGGGDLSTSRTFAVGSGTGITVNADDVALTVPVTAANGGTGQTSYAVGDLLYAGTTTTVAKLADIATGSALISGGVSTAPSYGKIGLTTHVSGTLPATSGGTGQSTTAVGDLLYGTATNTISKLAAVATGNALISGGVTTAPSWGKIALTTHVSGTLPIGNGGTGTTSGISAETQTALDLKVDDTEMAAKANVDDPSFTGSLIHSGSVAAASLSANQDNYSPDAGDLKAVWELSSSAAVNITGIGNATGGRFIFITNVNAPGGFAITLKNQDAASSAVNQFAFPADVVLNPRDGITLIRVASRWRMFSPYVGRTQSLVIACSDETTAITAGTAKVTYRMPYAFTLSAVRASLTTAQTSGTILTVDINEGGTSILGTKLTIDNTERTSTTAAAQATITDAALADDAEIKIDIDTVGDGTAKGLKVTLIGVPASPVMVELLRERLEDRLQ